MKISNPNVQGVLNKVENRIMRAALGQCGQLWSLWARWGHFRPFWVTNLDPLWADVCQFLSFGLFWKL